MPPGSAAAAMLSAWVRPRETRLTPSTGTTSRTMHSRPEPILRPAARVPEGSSVPSTMWPSKGMLASASAMAAWAASRVPVLSPRPSQRPTDRAADSVARSSSRAWLRSRAWPAREREAATRETPVIVLRRRSYREPRADDGGGTGGSGGHPGVLAHRAEEVTEERVGHVGPRAELRVELRGDEEGVVA